MSKRGWFLRLRALVIVTLSLMAVATGAMWGMSYSEVLLDANALVLPKRFTYDSRGLKFYAWRGVLSVDYSYPAEEPIDPNPSFIRTLCAWLQYFDATEICDICHSRMRPSESCPQSHSQSYGALFCYIPSYFPELNWHQRIAHWNSRVFNTVRSNSLIVRLWLPFALFAAYPCYLGIRAATRRWRKRGRDQCKVCGYLLIGNTSGICPECGQPVPEEMRSRLAE